MASRTAFLAVLLGLLIQAAIPSAWAGRPEEAAQALARGNTMLAQNAWQQAEAAFAEAARLDPANAAYRGELDVLHRVMKLRGELAGTTSAAQWDRTAAALRAYYYSKGIFGEALTLDREAHQRAGTPASAALLAETLLELNHDTEAASIFAQQPAAKLTPSARMLHGIALARTGDIATAKQIVSDVPLPFAATPNLLLIRARLLAGTGDHAGAVTLLKQAFEATTPSLLAQTRDRVQSCSDFSAMGTNSAFTQVMATASKMSESSCSKGPSCGACPSRTACGSK
jgi:tetratricopeptide (TPR) repeat protein